MSRSAADSGEGGVMFCNPPAPPAGPVGKFLIAQMAAVAELEAGLISQRTKAALTETKRRGVKFGDPRLRAGDTAAVRIAADAALAINTGQSNVCQLPSIQICFHDYPAPAAASAAVACRARKAAGLTAILPDRCHVRCAILPTSQTEGLTIMTLRAGREFLAIPGPTTVPDEVLPAMHRTAVDIYAGQLLALTDSLHRDVARGVPHPGP
jgi:hypothetical protein